MKKRLLAMVLAAAMTAMSLTACGTVGGKQESTDQSQATTESTETTDDTAADDTAQESTEGKVYKIGICQQLEHQALDAATEGFQAALVEKLGEGNVEFDYQNAQGEQTNCATIATKFVNSDVDLIMANATTALQACSAATADIPVIGTSVTDFVSAGVVNSNDAPGRNVTGTSDLAPIDQQVELLMQLAPEAKNVGILYCSAEPNSIFQADMAEAMLTEKGLTVSRYTPGGLSCRSPEDGPRRPGEALGQGHGFSPAPQYCRHLFQPLWLRPGLPQQGPRRPRLGRQGHQQMPGTHVAVAHFPGPDSGLPDQFQPLFFIPHDTPPPFQSIFAGRLNFYTTFKKWDCNF